jgi:hypothetical protein
MPGKGSFSGRSEGNMVMSWEKGDLSGKRPETPAALTYNIDRKTFGATGRITENDDQFAGLCLRCHHKENFTGNKADRIHRAVKGWGANKEHSFPCSKCHQVHNSGLPRLMQTNCLEAGPAGLRDSGAAPWVAEKKGAAGIPSRGATGAKKAVKESVVGCHVRRAGKGSAPADQSAKQPQWNSVNPW